MLGTLVQSRASRSQSPLLRQPCEVAAREIIPSIRASIALILIDEYKLSKYEAAKLLGVTPAAVTNYVNRRRGDRFVAKLMSTESSKSMLREAAEIVLSMSRGSQESAARLQMITCELCSSVNEVAQAVGCHYLNNIKPKGGAPDQIPGAQQR